MSLRILALASLASFVVAQTGPTGFGRFPCTQTNGDGTFSPDQSVCDNGLVAPGADDGSGDQIDGVTPVGAQCFQPGPNTPAFCGIAGAACSASSQCDNGYCNVIAGDTTGTCQGGFGAVCNGDSALCTGYTYCEAADGTPAMTCGGIGTYCNEPDTSGLTDAQAQAVYNQICESSYCNPDGNCAARLAPNAACDPVNAPFACANGQTCDSTTSQCVTPAGPSQRARARRNLNLNVCPASHTACAVSGIKAGFECIDVTSNLEQCGACASAGGVDCTTLPGVEGVACVSGQCEIWSCAEGFAWNASSGACEASA